MESSGAKKTLSDLLKGWNFPPRLVALVRGLFIAGGVAMAAYVGQNVTEIVPFIPFAEDLPDIGKEEGTAVFIITWLARYIEGEADQKIDPNQNKIESIADQKETRA